MSVQIFIKAQNQSISAFSSDFLLFGLDAILASQPFDSPLKQSIDKRLRDLDYILAWSLIINGKAYKYRFVGQQY